MGVFPKAIPWDVPIAELSPFWLQIECTCGRGTILMPLRLMSATIGWKRTLRTIVPQLRCKGCGAKPVSIALLERANGDGHSVAKGGEHVLAEASD